MMAYDKVERNSLRNLSNSIQLDSKPKPIPEKRKECNADEAFFF